MRSSPIAAAALSASAICGCSDRLQERRALSSGTRRRRPRPRAADSNPPAIPAAPNRMRARCRAVQPSHRARDVLDVMPPLVRHDVHLRQRAAGRAELRSAARRRTRCRGKSFRRSGSRTGRRARRIPASGRGRAGEQPELRRTILRPRPRQGGPVGVDGERCPGHPAVQVLVGVFSAAAVRRDSDAPGSVVPGAPPPDQAADVDAEQRSEQDERQDDQPAAARGDARVPPAPADLAAVDLGVGVERHAPTVPARGPADRENLWRDRVPTWEITDSADVSNPQSDTPGNPPNWGHRLKKLGRNLNPVNPPSRGNPNQSCAAKARLPGWTVVPRQPFPDLDLLRRARFGEEPSL